MVDLVRVRAENGAEVTVPATIAERNNLTPLDKPALNRSGLPLAPKERVDLRGRDLAVRARGGRPSPSGTAEEKRQRLADFQESGATVVGAAPNHPGGESAKSKEDSQ